MRPSAPARACCLACFCLILSHTASAQSAADNIQTWGLLGTWAVDCSKPPTQQTSLITYAIRQGEAVQLRDFGDAQDDNEVLSAAHAADGTIELRIRFPKIGQTREFTMMKGPGGRIRATVNRGPDGSYTIQNGLFVASRAPTPWQTRCY